MEKQQMTKEEALKVLESATAQLSANRATHNTIVMALQVFASMVKGSKDA